MEELIFYVCYILLYAFIYVVIYTRYNILFVFCHLSGVLCLVNQQEKKSIFLTNPTFQDRVLE